MAIFLVCFLLLLQHLASAAQDSCAPARCGDSGILIRFPFRLKEHHPDYCGYPGFDLSCSESNNPEFELRLPVKSPRKNVVFPVSVKVSIQEINYTSQVMKISALNTSCLPKELLHSMINSSQIPFEIAQEDATSYTLFNCSSIYAKKHPDLGNQVTCLNDRGYSVVGFPSFNGVSNLPLSSCTKMYDILNFPLEMFNGLSEFKIKESFVHWPRPSCANCEAEGKYCKLKGNGTLQEIQCFDIPKQPQDRGHRNGVSKSVVIICSAIGLLLVVIVGIVTGVASFKRKKEDQKKSEILLEDYKASKITSFSYSDIKKMTNHFKEKLGEGSYGRVYKGKLSNEVIVAVKLLNNFRGNAEEFINGVGRIERIHHVNVIRVVGYCADGNRRALVYEFLPNGSLQKIVSSESEIPSFDCKKRQEIAIGIAKGIDHIHQGSSNQQQILHLDLKPQNILLDENNNPKITDIGLARLSSKEMTAVSLASSQGITDYVAPEVLSSNFHIASDKSDVYSFGMLLFNMVGRRESSRFYFPEWIYDQFNTKEDEAGGNSIINKKLAIIGLWCTQWYPEDRPSINVVVRMLEGENAPIMPPNTFLFGRSEQPNTNSALSPLSQKS